MLAVIWPDFSYYHMARFRCLHELLKEKVIGIELMGGKGDDHTSQWRCANREGLPIVTLFPESDMKTLSRRRLGMSMIAKLEECGCDTVFINGYGVPEFRMVLDWSSRTGRRCFSFFETKRDDVPRFLVLEWLKSNVVKKLDGVICGGELHRKYAIQLGVKPDKAIIGYDVVDNDFFARSADEARRRSGELRMQIGLPQKYFMSACRFVEKKNLMRLLEAYKLYRTKAATGKPWALVLCGAGPMEMRLKEKVMRENIPEVYFPGPQGPESLAVYYGLASGFILASTVEQWGLVINEAMASGLPVICTKVAGAADELIIEGETGSTFDPRNVRDIANKMLWLSSLCERERLTMGSKARELVCTKFPLKRFVEGVIELIGDR